MLPSKADSARCSNAYLAKRGDIAFLERWPQAVAQRDCDFLTVPARYVDSEEDWLPGEFYPLDPAG